MTKKEAIDKALHIIDLATISGNAADVDTNGDIKKTMEQLLDNATLFAFSLKNPTKKFSFFNKPLENLAPCTFETKVFNVDNAYTIFSPLAKSCSFSVSGNCTIEIETGKDRVGYINSLNEFTCYKLSTPESSGIKIRIFSNNMPFFVKNVALYKEYFEDKEKIPAYGFLNFFDLPDDFQKIKNCYLQGLTGLITDFEDFYLQENKFGVPYNIFGEIFLEYFRRYKKVNIDATDNFIIDCPSECEHIVPLKLALLAIGCYEQKTEYFSKLQKMLDDAVDDFKSNIINYQDKINRIKSVYKV